MRSLGISIYPNKSSYEDIEKYLIKAQKYGFSRIFETLLTIDEDVNLVKEKYLKINELAKSLGYTIFLDVSPKVFKKLGISYNDLSFFNEMKVDGLRLDESFSGLEESLMTYNKYNLKIELNMSKDVPIIENILSYIPKKDNIVACHNFYPHINTGLSLDFFKKTTDRFYSKGIKTAAFVTSQNSNTFYENNVDNGLCTLEMHRKLPMHIQAKHLVAIGTIDDIIISNCYPSDEELEEMSKINPYIIKLEANIIEGCSDLIKTILFEEEHFNRGDVSNILIRSTQSRVKYKNEDFPLFNVPRTIKRGDIIIESNEAGHYKGEMQVALKDIKNPGYSNVVGHISKEEIFILDEIKPWQKFLLIQSK